MSIPIAHNIDNRKYEKMHKNQTQISMVKNTYSNLPRALPEYTELEIPFLPVAPVSIRLSRCSRSEPDKATGEKPHTIASLETSDSTDKVESSGGRPWT